MRRSDWLPRTSWTLAAVVWFAAGPLMLPIVGAIRCHHGHAMTMAHSGSIPASNPQAPCYCDQMSAGPDGALPLAPAVPAVFPSAPTPMVEQLAAPRSHFHRPTSRVTSPTPPPPIVLG